VVFRRETLCRGCQLPLDVVLGPVEKQRRVKLQSAILAHSQERS
jgi:hypothetical protein